VGEYETEGGLSTDADMPGDLDKASLIHPSFPPMGVINPSHLGSQSNLPRGAGDYEENIPKTALARIQDTLNEKKLNIANKMSPMPDKKKK
jgi:hypothetical protein